MGDLEKPMHVDPVCRFFQVFRGARKKMSCFLSDIQDKIVNLHKPNKNSNNMTYK